MSEGVYFWVSAMTTACAIFALFLICTPSRGRFSRPIPPPLTREEFYKIRNRGAYHCKGCGKYSNSDRDGLCDECWHAVDELMHPWIIEERRKEFDALFDRVFYPRWRIKGNGVIMSKDGGKTWEEIKEYD